MDQPFAGNIKTKSKPEVKLPKVGKVPLKQVRVNLCKKDSVLVASKCLGTREVKNGKETKGGETKRTKVKAFVAKKVVKDSAILAPRKGMGSKIAAINEDGNHESEAGKELRKGKSRKEPSCH